MRNLIKKIKEFVANKNPLARLFQNYYLKTYFSNMQDRKTEEDYFPAQTFIKAVEFVRDTKNSKNVIAVIDEFDPHEVWDPPQKYLDLYVDKNYTGKKVVQPTYSETIEYLSEGELEYMRASYAGEVSMCDNWFGNFIDELKNLELYDDSLIILISDHGHSIGDHNATGKIPMYMYPELVDIPFIIKPPCNLNSQKRIKKSYVYDHDILPTIFGFVNKEKSEVFDGIDLSIFLNDGDQLIENRDYITCGFGICTLYKDDHHALIISNDKSHRKLFDLRKDPEWNENIANDNLDIVDELFEKIKKDAKGDLLLEHQTSEEIHKLISQLKNWYGQDKGTD